MIFNNSIRYRIGIINDFKSVFAYVDYKKFGIVEILDACAITTEHRGYNITKDSIGVFLNYKLVGETKSKAEALKMVEALIEKAPLEAKRDLTEQKYYLTDAL